MSQHAMYTQAESLLCSLSALVSIHIVFVLAGAGQSATSQRAFLPVERELVFDIDLTDYDDVRTCGKEGHICNKCWPLMALAIQVHPLEREQAGRKINFACCVILTANQRRVLLRSLEYFTLDPLQE